MTKLHKQQRNLRKMTDTEERIKRIRNAYEFILRREDAEFATQRRIDALQFLEKELGTKFDSTLDFITKMDKYIVRISGAEELKRIRENKNLSLEQLGKKLGYSEQFVQQMEKGTRFLTAKTIEFIEKHT